MVTKVCVTGATGFIARFVIDQLLREGYHVVGTVRSLRQRDKMEYLEYLRSKYDNRLTLCEADLFDGEALERAIEGCEGVFHIASPYKFLPPDTPEDVARKEMVDPAVKGTENVYKACAKWKNTVKKVIYMSSVFAMVNSYSTNMPNVIDENSWNTDKSILDAGDPYHYSKVVAEKEAWKLFNDLLKPHNIEMVSVAPVYVLGPVIPDISLPSAIQEKLRKNKSLLNEGIGIFVDYFNGKEDSCYDMTIGLVDVRDVATVFVRAFQFDSAKSPDRYLCSQSEMRFIEVCDLLRKKYPQYKFPTKTTIVGEASAGRFHCNVHLTNEKLGIQWMPLDRSISDMYSSFLSLGYISE